MRDDIFKAYDVRGLYPDEIDAAAGRAIGFGLGRFLDRHRRGAVVIGRDMRAGSEELAAGLTAGLQHAGRGVIDIGRVTTPMAYFAVNRLGAAGGAMVTASHNPGRYNGVKLVREEAIPLGSGSGLEEVRDEALRAPAIGGTASAAESVSVADDYARFLIDRFGTHFRRKVVIDAGNGMAGEIVPRVLDPLGVDYDALFFEPDGAFPNHEANPLKDENLADLKRAVRRVEGSIGVAFDGDGDRVAFLDETGARVRGDLITALLAESLLDGAGEVLYDLRSSHAVPEAIEAIGGTPIRIRVGHAFIKQAMREHDAVCGGELSYHYYFRDFFYCESGVLAMLVVLRRLEERDERLADAVAPLDKYAHSGEIDYEVENAHRTIERVAGAFADAAHDRLDGLTVEYPEWWFNLRASNTEPLLRLNLEAATPEEMRDRLRCVERVITRGEVLGA